MEADESILSKMGQYPVIKLTLKSAKQPGFYEAFMKLMDEISFGMCFCKKSCIVEYKGEKWA